LQPPPDPAGSGNNPPQFTITVRVESYLIETLTLDQDEFVAE